MSTVPNPTFWQSAGELFSDPNFIQMLGGIGAQMDKRGAGGILGRSAIAFSRNKAAQDLAAKQLAGGELERRELREMNRKLLERLGPITPPGTEGLNSAKESKMGALELDVDTGDPVKFASDLGGFSAAGTPGVTSMSRTPTGSYKFVVDAPPLEREPLTVAEQLDDFAPSNLYNPRAPQKLSYTPVNPQERLNEMADLMETQLPPTMYAAMKTPTVQRVSQAASNAQLQSDVNELTGAPAPRRSLRRSIQRTY